MSTFQIQPGVAYLFEFKNFRGETSERLVITRSLQWGHTPWHKEVQFFLEAFDLAKQEVRSFPISLIEVRSFRRLTDEELDVALTDKVRIAVEAVRAEFTPKVEGENLG